MSKIVFATNNQHKLEEVSSILEGKVEILSLNDINCFEDIPETADTLEGNALLKARFVKEKYGYNCFADDTGLEIKALNNAPGVISARYAGEQKDAQDNMRKVLTELNGESERQARFRTVIALILDGQEHLFEGIVTGDITETAFGNGGFGYDPIFRPEGYDCTFAELSSNEKNSISHRGRAVQKLIEFLSR
ncbi:non-canonical purine NTP diphosphatase [Parabacteroides sp. FAFU027]|uniref:non-canonical purine NTP diphosphatase n=1 Tax=Parabacteroides sp. FAFU027 TaxID=2922715 RepID=UPI001FAF97A0|nr:non-canonical purine NTP diphosphatase [Parabacteroides sp. FAFU027]